MRDVGFQATADNVYVHPKSRYTVDFPRGPLAVGSKSIDRWNTVERSSDLHVLTLFDCVRDRFMGYFAWADYSSLRVAIDVAHAHSDAFDLDEFNAWALEELRTEPLYDRARVETFLREFARSRGR